MALYTLIETWSFYFVIHPFYTVLSNVSAWSPASCRKRCVALSQYILLCAQCNISIKTKLIIFQLSSWMLKTATNKTFYDKLNLENASFFGHCSFFIHFVSNRTSALLNKFCILLKNLLLGVHRCMLKWRQDLGRIWNARQGMEMS